MLLVANKTEADVCLPSRHMGLNEYAAKIEHATLSVGLLSIICRVIVIKSICS